MELREPVTPPGMSTRTLQPHQLPSSDLFAELGSRERNEVEALLAVMLQIDGEVKLGTSIRSAAIECASAWPGRRGFSAASLQRRYATWIEGGRHWSALLNRSKAGANWYRTAGGGNGGLPAAFIEECASRWGRNQRDKFYSAWRDLCTEWKQWRNGDRSKALPGYDRAPEPDPETGIPRGWSYENLYRHARRNITEWQRKQIQIGPKRAAELGPSIRLTRVGMEPGQFYVPDDSWNDFTVTAAKQTCRLLSLHALDLASGVVQLSGHKPAITGEKDTEERLKEADMIYLLVALLTGTGYHAEGCEIVCEKATATVREREERILHDHGTGVRVNRGPKGGGPGIAGLFTGPGAGNPRHKAALESWHNLLRNRTADQLEWPGQTGSNSRINRPEGLAGLERDTRALLHAMTVVTPETAELLRLGLLTAEQASRALDAMIEVINCRTDHDLEGWAKAGNLVKEWRPMALMEWQPMERLLELPEGSREATATLIARDPSLYRERAMSPREVFERGRPNLRKLDPVVGALLLADLPGTERPVKKGVLEVNCPEVDPDEPLQFGLELRDGRGRREKLRDGDTYLARVNRLDPRWCWLYDARGGFVGVVASRGRAQRNDVEAIHRQWAEKRAALAPELERTRQLAAPLSRAATARAAHNAAVLAQDGRTERCPVKGKAEDFLDLVGGDQDDDSDTAVGAGVGNQLAAFEDLED